MDGQIEVINKALEDYLIPFTRDDQDRWDKMLIMANGLDRDVKASGVPVWISWSS